MPITHESCVLDANGNPLDGVIGDVSLLKTGNKTLTGAINEVFGDIIKQQIADILVINGIDSSNSDTWSSIINKLNEGFATSNNKGLDIITANRLPDNGEPGQICIISENNIESYVITTDPSYSSSDSIILLSSSDAYNYLHSVDNQQFILNIAKVTLGEKRLDSYYFDNSWIQLTTGYIMCLDNKNYPTESIFGQFDSTSLYKITSNGLEVLPLSGTTNYKTWVTAANAVDFTPFTKCYIKISNHTTVISTISLGIILKETSDYSTNTSTGTSVPVLYSSYQSTGADKILEYDISSWAKTGYFGLFISNHPVNSYNIGTVFTITDIYFE